jgi:hypothetical protein
VPGSGRALGKAALVAVAVTVCLAAWETLAFRDATGWRIYVHYLFIPFNGWGFRVAALAFTLASLIQVAALLFCARFLALLAIWGAIAFDQGYLGAYGRLSTEEDILVALTVSGTQRQDAVALFFDPRSWGAGLILAPLLWMGRAAAGRLLPLIALGSLGFYSLAHLAEDRLFFRLPFPAVSLGSFQRSATAFLWRHAAAAPVQREFVAPIEGATPKVNVVLIVDESVTGDHLSINGYERLTTPFLSGLKARGDLLNLGLAVAGTTCSHSSGHLLLTGVRPQDLPDPAGLQRSPSLLQFARAAGLRTHFFDGQMNSFWLGARWLWKGNAVDRLAVDEWRGASEFAAPTAAATDRRLARRLRQTLERQSGAFIWVLKAGAHPAYTSCTAATTREWTPATDMSDPVAMVNAYDNCIREGVDGFFATLFEGPTPWLERTVVIYTSDHGQTLGRGGARHSQCGDTSTEVVVPLFIVGSAERLAKVERGWRDRASHENIFATVLDLSGASARKTGRYAPSLLDPPGAVGPRVFMGINVDVSRTVVFDESLIRAGGPR